MTLKSMVPAVWTIIVGQFLINLAFYSIYPFLALYLLRNHVSTAVIGSILGARTLANMLGTVVGGWWANRTPSRRVMSLGFFGTGMGYFIMAATTSSLMAIGGLFAASFFSGVAYPAESKAILENTTPNNRTEIYSALRMVINLAGGVAPLLALAFFLPMPRFSFGVFAGITITYGLSALRWIPSRVGESRVSQSRSGSYRAVLRNQSFMWTLLSLTLSSMAYSLLVTLLPLFMSSMFPVHGHKLYAIILWVNTIMVIFLQLPTTAFSRRIGQRASLILGQSLYFVSLVAVGFAGAFSEILAAFALFTVGEMLISPSGFALLTRNIPTEQSATYMAIAQLRNGFAQSACSFVGGLILQVNGGRSMVFSFAGYAFFAVAFSLLPVLLARAHTGPQQPIDR